MKIRIELAPHECPEDADDFLSKAIVAKQDEAAGERFADEYLNEFERHVAKLHEQVLEQIAAEITAEVERHAD